MNYEEFSTHLIAIQVRDNAPTPKSAIFELTIKVTDVNEPITGVMFAELDPFTQQWTVLENVKENLEPGNLDD